MFVASRSNLILSGAGPDTGVLTENADITPVNTRVVRKCLRQSAFFSNIIQNKLHNHQVLHIWGLGLNYLNNKIMEQWNNSLACIIFPKCNLNSISQADC